MPENHSDLFRRCLESCDIEGVRKLWAHVAPHLPQPNGDYQVQVMIHSARTQAASMPLRLRAYSHQWLLANGLPSQLPNDLKPKAEQMDFKFSFGVGIGMKMATTDPQKRAVGQLIQRAMGEAVEEAFADRRTETVFLRQRMVEAKERTIRSLGRPKINVTVGYDFSGFPARTV